MIMANRIRNAVVSGLCQQFVCLMRWSLIYFRASISSYICFECLGAAGSVGKGWVPSHAADRSFRCNLRFRCLPCRKMRNVFTIVHIAHIFSGQIGKICKLHLSSLFWKRVWTKASVLWALFNYLQFPQLLKSIFVR